MNDDILRQHINDLIDGTIGETAHLELQERLKSDENARCVFRERMDLEAGLRTCAADGLMDEQPAANQSPSMVRPKRPRTRWMVTLLTAAASILAITLWWTQQPNRKPQEIVNQPGQADPQDSPQPAMLLGRLVQQADCDWDQEPSLQADRFRPGKIKLASGAAELQFDSGTNVILEGPCELTIETIDSAKLLAGTVFVNVTEVSNGFLLETPEAQIIDEGTQYAVALNSEAAEVHVFDGSVIWASAEPDSEFEERIPSGEARRYLRSDPGRSNRMPFGKRQFVRQIEASVREAGGGDLVAYDGFENLAGLLRRGRSGFGWSGGWQSAGRGRGTLAKVIDAPNNVVFGVNRSGRRLLSLRGGDDLRRSLEEPFELSPGTSVYVSLLISRRSSNADDDSSMQIMLEPKSASRRYQRRHSVSFGITSLGEPFLNNAGTVSKVAMELSGGETYLLILKYVTDRHGATAGLRVYNPGSSVDLMEPTVWTEASSTFSPPASFSTLRMAADSSSDWHIDELKIGSSWQAVITEVQDAKNSP